MKVVINASDRAIDLEQESLPSASPAATYAMRSADLRATYRTTWAASTQTMLNLLPKLEAVSFLAATANTYRLNYSLGHLYFGVTNIGPNMRCFAVDVDPEGKSDTAGRSSGGIGWTHANLVAHYRAAPIVQLAELYEESMDPAFESSTMPARKLFWDAAGTTEPLGRDEAPRRISSLIRWSYTIKGMPSLPTDLKSYQGFINTSEMTSPTYNLAFPAGTVYFRSPHIIPSIGMMGARLFDVTMEFIVKLEGATEDTWNKEYKAATRALQAIHPAGGGGAFEQFDNVDLNDLLLALVDD